MLNVRKAVIQALIKVNNDNAYSNIVFGKLLKDGEFNDKDRKFAATLFYGTLERKLTLDYILNSFTSKPFSKIKPFTKEALRIAAYQIIYMDKVPKSAAVNESVKLVKASNESFNSGFVNGVLRSLIRDGFTLPEDLSVKSLAIRYSCSENTVSGFIDDYGTDFTVKILSEFLKPAHLFIRVNNLTVSENELITLLSSENIICEKTDIENCILIKSNFKFDDNELLRKGYFHIQDYTSQYCVQCLSPLKNERILDICAAPGGKTFTAAEKMLNTGEIVSCDLYENRCDLIKKSAEKLHLTNITTKTADASVFDKTLGKFDRILCDVPCSGLGVLRRKPEIKYKDISDFSSLERTQRAIIENAAAYLKPGGTLIYSTCTLRKAENENIAQGFLENHPDFKMVFSKLFVPDELHDGFFIAKFVRDVNTAGKN